MQHATALSAADPIEHNRPLITAEDRAAVDAVLRSGWIAEGPEVVALERWFDSRSVGSGSCAVSSGTAALYLALRALEVAEGECVAVPTYSCSALLNAIHMVRARPVLIDVRADDFNIDPQSLTDAARRVPLKAVVVVHCFGASADIAEIKGICPIVIEDCCHSLGGERDGRFVGGEGSAAIFSFYATKIVTAGQGGCVRAPRNIAKRARDIREFDQRDDYKPRFNFQMTDYQAALVRSQLARLDSITSRRHATAKRYLAAVRGDLGIQSGLSEEGRLVYRFVLKFSGPEARETAKRHFAERGIRTIVPIEHHELLHRYLGEDAAAFPVAERLAATTLSLPVYPGLTDRQVDRVCDAIRDLPQV